MARERGRGLGAPEAPPKNDDYDGEVLYPCGRKEFLREVLKLFTRSSFNGRSWGEKREAAFKPTHSGPRIYSDRAARARV